MALPWHFSERGSMAPLGIGLFALSLSFVLAFASAGSLFIFQKRLTNYAEMAALHVVTKDSNVWDFQDKVGSQNFTSLQLAQQLQDDDSTVRVSACAQWNAPFVTFLSLPLAQICSNAFARSG